jgi:hypothetical protein
MAAILCIQREHATSPLTTPAAWLSGDGNGAIIYQVPMAQSGSKGGCTACVTMPETFVILVCITFAAHPEVEAAKSSNSGVLTTR